MAFIMKEALNEIHFRLIYQGTNGFVFSNILPLTPPPKCLVPFTTTTRIVSCRKLLATNESYLLSIVAALSFHKFLLGVLQNSRKYRWPRVLQFLRLVLRG